MASETTNSTTSNPATPPYPRTARRRKKHHAHHGGSWKVAYADFITTMMALFLVLWLTNSTDDMKRALISLYFRDPGIFDNEQGGNMNPGSGAPSKMRKIPIVEVAGSGVGGMRSVDTSMPLERLVRKLQRELQRLGTQRGVTIEVMKLTAREGIQIQLSDSGDHPLFQENSAVMTRRAEALVKDVSEILHELSAYRIAIAAHTRARTKGKDGSSNRSISVDRAQRVMQMLVANEIRPERFDEVIGYGDTRPIDKYDENSSYNSRITLTLTHEEPVRRTKVPVNEAGLPPEISRQPGSQAPSVSSAGIP